MGGRRGDRRRDRRLRRSPGARPTTVPSHSTPERCTCSASRGVSGSGGVASVGSIVGRRRSPASAASSSPSALVVRASSLGVGRVVASAASSRSSCRPFAVPPGLRLAAPSSSPSPSPSRAVRAPFASPPPFFFRRRPPRRRLPFGKFRSSSRASALGLRAIRMRAPSSTCCASGVCASAAASSAADSRRSCLRAACTSRRALRACAAPAEFTSRPSSRFVSGQRCTAYSSCTSREYSARCQSHRAAWSRRPIWRSVSAWSSTFTPSRRSSRDQPPTISTASSNASASRRLPDLAQRAQPQLRVAVAAQAGDQEQPPQLAGRVEVQHRLRPPPVVRRHARAREHRPRLLLAPAQVLHGDPPQLALEDLRAPLAVRRDRHDPALHAQPAAASAPHRAHHDRAAAVDVAVEQRVQRHDRVVVRRRRVDEVHDDPRLLAGRAPRDAPHALLVDALRGRRRQVHADRRPRRVPALGQQLRVHQHVDLAALVARQDPRELALRRLARHGLRLDARVRRTPSPRCARASRPRSTRPPAGP